MSVLKELREKRGKLIHDARELLDKAKEDKRGLNAEEQKTYDSLMDQQAGLRQQMDNETRLLEAAREEADQVPDEEKEKRGPEKDAKEFRRAAFNKALCGGVASLNADEARALQAGTDPAGGYLQPDEEFVNRLIKAVDDQVFMRQKATKFTVTAAEKMGVPSLENDPADADWTTELAIGSEDSTMSVGKRQLEPHPMAKLLKISDKLLRSVPSAEDLARDRLGYKVGVTQEKAFLLGTGASQPLGVMVASASGISTGRDVSTGNTTTAITFDGLIECKFSLKGNYWNRADWMFHRDALKQLTKLKNGDGDYIWRESVREGEPDRLLGRPFMMSEYMPNTFTTGLYLGILGDFTNYWVVDALAMRIQRLVELYAATNQIGLVVRLETDGAPVLEEAFSRVTLA